MKQKNKLYSPHMIYDFKELLDFSSQNFKNNIAFKFKKEVKSPVINITYSDFMSDIRKLATSLIDLGLEDKKVAIISPNRYEWCVSYFGITTSNIVVVPLDKSLPDNEIEGLIIRSKVDAVIFDEKYSNIFSKIKNDGLSNIKYYICMDCSIAQNGFMSYIELIENGSNLINNNDNRYNNIKIDNKKMSVMLFTSGTTSTSKAVMLSQYNICSNINAIKSIVNIDQNDVFLSFLPLHHTFECSTTFLTGISCGITIAFCDGLKYIVKNMIEYKITAFVCVPLMLESMYKKIIKGIEDSGKKNLISFITKISNFLFKFKIDIRRLLFKSIITKLGGHLRLIISGAASINKETIDGFNSWGINLIQGYGLTETSPVLCGENDKFKKSGSTGFPLYNIDLKIDSPDENGIGEIIAKGDSIMLGYYENEQATNEVLKNGWFYTGDLGYIDEDGYIFIKGRKKTVIVLKNGKNIFPEEIETLVNNLPFVKESMIYEKKAKNDSDLACKIVYDKEIMHDLFNTDDDQKYKEIILHEIKKINKTMPPYKYIRDIIITEEPLIKTTTQKIKRHEELKQLST